MDMSLNTCYSDFIVPILYNSRLLGTGIIHKSLLITAAHVVEELQEDKREFSLVYQTQSFIVQWERELFFEYDKEKHGYYRDLAIFKTDILLEGLNIELENRYNERTASIYGYYGNDHTDMAININTGRIRMKPVLENNIPLHKNTFLLMDVDKIDECNSGGPLLNHKKAVLGILSAGNKYYRYARFVSSSHILEVLSNNNRCKESLLNYE